MPRIGFVIFDYSQILKVSIRDMVDIKIHTCNFNQDCICIIGLII